MNETTAIAQSMARHERVLARLREAGAPVAETPPFAQQLAAANPPVPIAPAAAPDAPVAAASRAMPGLVAAGDTAAAPPPPETPVVSALPVELSDGQRDVLLRSLGATPANDGAAGSALPAAQPAASAFATPVAPRAARPAVEAAAEAAMGKSVDRAAELSPEQMALLMQSFGIDGSSGGQGAAAEAAAALPGPPASADLRFYPVAPRPAGENAAAAATASDAYLRTLRTVKGRAGLYGE